MSNETEDERDARLLTYGWVRRRDKDWPGRADKPPHPAYQTSNGQIVWIDPTDDPVPKTVLPHYKLDGDK
jgi:hypothetical protein